MADTFFSKPIKKISCLNEEDGRVCNRFLGEIRADTDVEETRLCPKCGTEWLIRQGDGVLTMKKVKKGLKKDHGADDGVRVVVESEETPQ